MRIVSIPFAVWLAAFPLSDILVAQQSLAERLPADTLLYLSLDTGRLVDGALELDLANLLDEAQVREFLAPVAAQAKVEVSTDGIRRLINSVPWQSYVNGRVELGLRGFEVSIGGQRLTIAPSQPIDARMLNRLSALAEQLATEGGGSVVIEPDVVLSIDVGDRFAAWYGEMIDGLPRQGVPVKVERCAIGGRDVTRLAFQPDSEGPKIALHIAADQGRWWVAGSAAALERTLAGGQGASLARDAAFRRCVDQVAIEPAALLAYFNAAHVARIFDRLVPPIVKEELDLLGLSSVESVGFASSFVAGGVRDSIALSWSQPPTGLLSLLDCVDGGFDYLNVAPVETGFYLGLRIAPEAFVDKLALVADQFAPGSSRGLDQAFARIEAELGVDVREALLPAFGDELGVYLTPPGGGAMLPDGMVMLEVGDREQFAKLFAMVREMAAQQGAPFSDARGLPPGVEGFTLALPDAPIHPAFALTKEALCIAPNVLALKSSLKALENGRTESALGNPRLQQVLTGLTGKPSAAGLSLLAFVDLHQLVVLGYPFLPMVAETLHREVGVDPSALPEVDAVAPHLSGIGIAGRSDRHGLVLSLFTPTGLLPLAASAAIWQHSARESAHTMAAMATATQAISPTPAEVAASELGQRDRPAGKTRSLGSLFASLEKATGATIDFPDSIADVQVSYHAKSGDLDVILAELAVLVGFGYSIDASDGERLVTITRG